jgi:hypothetical protein
MAQGHADTVAFTRGYVAIDTLTANHDTIDVVMRGDELGIYYYSVVMYRTSAGYDTVDVYCLAGDGNTWYQEAITDMKNITDSTRVTITETPRGFLFQQPFIRARFITPDGVAATRVILSGRKESP